MAKTEGRTSATPLPEKLAAIPIGPIGIVFMGFCKFARYLPPLEKNDYGVQKSSRFLEVVRLGFTMLEKSAKRRKEISHDDIGTL